MRVLVVEDDKVTRELVTEQLLTGGHQVQAVESAESARALVGALGFPDTAVIDICLPGLDGWSLMRFLRQQRSLRPTAVVILTADPMPAEALLELTDGDCYLVKPATTPELLAAVDHVYRARAGESRPSASETRLPDELSLNRR